MTSATWQLQLNAKMNLKSNLIFKKSEISANDLSILLQSSVINWTLRSNDNTQWRWVRHQVSSAWLLFCELLLVGARCCVCISPARLLRIFLKEYVTFQSFVFWNAIPVNVYGFPLFHVKRFVILFLDREDEGQRSPYADWVHCILDH